jgi:hypothetical protein
MVFFGLIPALFVATSYCLLPVVGQVPRIPLDRIALGFFYMSVALLFLSLILGSRLFLDLALALNLAFGIVAAVSFVARTTGTNKPSRFPASTIACLGVAVFILADFALLEFAALQQLFSGSSNGNFEGYQDLSLIPVVWKHVIWFMGHPEVIVIFFLMSGLLVDGLRFVLFRRVAA